MSTILYHYQPPGLLTQNYSIAYKLKWKFTHLTTICHGISVVFLILHATVLRLKKRAIVVSNYVFQSERSSTTNGFLTVAKDLSPLVTRLKDRKRPVIRADLKDLTCTCIQVIWEFRTQTC